MTPQRRPQYLPAAGGPRASAAAASTDWPAWQRETERKRRLVARQEHGAARNPGGAFWANYHLAATDSSFRLDGLALPEGDLAAALGRGWAGKAFRSRQQQRVRNHVAILRHIEKLLGDGAVLKSNDVVRWYTSVACGLSTTQLDEAAASRLDGIVRQINSPHLRLCPAVQGIARLHSQMLADPVVPSFNGILARLLLRYHLGRCGLPPVIFAPDSDGPALREEPRLLVRLLELIDETYALLLAK